MTPQTPECPCARCGTAIDPERLEALPETRVCIGCATKHPEPPRHDPNEVCARASAAGRNGFAAND